MKLIAGSEKGCAKGTRGEMTLQNGSHFTGLCVEPEEPSPAWQIKLFILRWTKLRPPPLSAIIKHCPSPEPSVLFSATTSCSWSFTRFYVLRQCGLRGLTHVCVFIGNYSVFLPAYFALGFDAQMHLGGGGPRPGAHGGAAAGAGQTGGVRRTAGCGAHGQP